MRLFRSFRDDRALLRRSSEYAAVLMAEPSGEDQPETTLVPDDEYGRDEPAGVGNLPKDTTYHTVTEIWRAVR